MEEFKVFLEKKQRNPIRKKELELQDQYDYNDPMFFERMKDFIIGGDESDLDARQGKIRKYYQYLIDNNQIQKAEKFLIDQIKLLISEYKRVSFKKYKKIYELWGVQVFLVEKNTVGDFSPNSKNIKDLRHSLLVMLVYVRDIIPNRKPKILITDIYKHPKTRESAIKSEFKPAGFYYDKIIYINESEVNNPSVFVHELAHWIVELIPRQTRVLLNKAFDDMLDFYYRLIKKRRVPTEEITDNMRRHMAKRLGFDEYGLTDKDEFFAVLIESWKTLPNNKITYKFKSTVKQILSRI